MRSEHDAVVIYKQEGISHNNWCIAVNDCDNIQGFAIDLGIALAQLSPNNVDMGAILEIAFPIAFKIAGYKAETVRERRTLFCGALEPITENLVASSSGE